MDVPLVFVWETRGDLKEGVGAEKRAWEVGILEGPELWVLETQVGASPPWEP